MVVDLAELWCVQDLTTDEWLFQSGRAGKRRGRLSEQQKHQFLQKNPKVARAEQEHLVRTAVDDLVRHSVAMNHLTCQGADKVISSVFDAGRLGRPAQEILLHFAVELHDGVPVPLPPRVHWAGMSQLLFLTR